MMNALSASLLASVHGTVDRSRAYTAALLQPMAVMQERSRPARSSRRRRPRRAVRLGSTRARC